jgi:hypothetical protein
MDSIFVTHADVPLYPVVARQARLSGIVDVRILVKGGSIDSVDLMPGSNPVLAIPAVENIKTWSFSPQSYGDFCVTYSYKLDSSELVSARNPTVLMEFPERVTITSSPVQASSTDSKDGSVK